ncbi:Fucosyltransferase, N-terminal [Halocaridina rubra]|uniref:Fucosyltransferase n=1 Tax=Halocaridina rubra TaxID=373956 RepID=A0AAN8WRF0_HALRR
MMTPLIYMRITLVHVMRVLWSWRLPFVALISIVLVCTNIIISSKTRNIYPKHDDNEAIGTKYPLLSVYDPSLNSEGLQDPPKVSLSRLLQSGHHAISPEPEVKKELSLGVQEEENSAREVLDGEPQRVRVEDNAANEVNSIEQRSKVGMKVSKGSTFNDEAEKSFHELPVEQREGELHTGNGNNWRNLTKTELNNLSILGRRLFLNENVGAKQNKQFIVLVWKSGPSIERRLIRQYGKERLDPFRKCSVSNCNITYNDSLVSTADAILIHFHRTRGPSSFPSRANWNQRWIWLSDESPYHTFMVAKDKHLSHYNGYFNWSMSYRMDSDVPVPYGRTILMTEEEASLFPKVDYFNMKSKTVAIMGSNCGGKNKRWNYVKELKKYMEVDAYGGCGNLKCPGHFTADCQAISDYKFYLAFENGNCMEYITEKVWWNAIEKGAVPVVMGGKREEYNKILPPNSFIHIDDFSSPKTLAYYLKSVANDSTRYMQYHAWRSKFRVANEHGYFASDVFHYCRLCEALNYNDPSPKVYNDMEGFWNVQTQCYPPTWQDRMNGI